MRQARYFPHWLLQAGCRHEEALMPKLATSCLLGSPRRVESSPSSSASPSWAVGRPGVVTVLTVRAIRCRRGRCSRVACGPRRSIGPGTPG
ncbi:hypothetical protein ACFQ6E_00395 [Streptomyces sp. NPDC056462]|uniref:hypothetical protein n=1 Tax=Streptomyces sp. NPDC056462 TaxID=3345826 RepID=UPI00369277E6